MTDDPKDLTPNEAREALAAVNAMERAGWRRAVFPRWVNAGYALFAAVFCALFAIDTPKPTYFYWWGIAYIIFISYVTNNTVSVGRDFPPPSERRLVYWVSTIGLLALAIGGAMLRQE